MGTTIVKKMAAAITGGALTLMATTAAQSQEAAVSVSGNLGVVTDYRFRGISQSNTDPAVQGGVDLEFRNGFYVGTWASTVDFDYGEDETSIEQDIYGGYSADISDTVSFDVGYIVYLYHSDRDEDYQELYGSVSISDLTLGLVYSDDYFAETGTFYYPYAEYSFALPAEMSLDLHLGMNMLDEDGGFLSDGEDSYMDYSVGVSKEFGGLSLSASVVGTNLDEDEGCWGTDWCDTTLVAGATYTW